MLEPAPSIETNEKIITLMVAYQQSGDLQKIQNEYYYWDKVKYRANDSTPEDLWRAVKLDRLLKQKKIVFNSNAFNYVITDYIQKSLHKFDMHIGGTLGSNIGIADTDKTKFVVRSIMEEAISSSQMEGANTTRKKAKELIQENKKPRNKSELMILNNFSTMKYIIQNKNQDLTHESLLHIHKLMTAGTLDSPKDEGRIRNNNEIHVVNYTNGEIVHTPPQKDEIDLFLKDLCTFFNTDDKEFIHPIIKACIIHFMIGWIHPFVDGNGRTARAVFYWYLLKKGYWLVEYLSISRIIKDTKAQYEKAYIYSEIDGNDLTYFITYHIKTMEKAFVALKKHISQKQKEVVQAAKFMRIPGINNRMAQILKILNDDSDRVLSVKKMSSRFNVSDFTARKDLKTLSEIGFVEEIKVNKQKRNYIKSAQFNNILSKFNV